MNLNEYGERYLQEKDFLTLCEDCEIKILNSSIDSKVLTEFEKLKALLPDFIIKKSKRFEEFCYRNNYDHNFNLVFPKKYLNLKENIEAYLYWHYNNQIFHPFDKKKISSFIRIPSRHRYNQGKFKINYEGETVTLERNLGFYSYWKIYPLFEMLDSCKLNYHINIFNEKTFRQFMKFHLPYKRIHRWSLPDNPKFIIDEYEKWFKYFDFLSFYVQAIRNIHTTYNPSPRSIYTLHNMEQEKYKLFMKERERKITQTTLIKYKIEESEVFNFLRFLIQKFFEFEKLSKEKLCTCIRNDIEYLIMFIRVSYGYDLECVYKRIGRVRSIIYLHPLEYIVEGKSALAREHLFRAIKEEVQRCFKEIDVPVEEQSVNRFIQFCKRNYLSTIYSAIYDVSWGKYEYNNIINNLTILAMNYERFIKTIYKTDMNKETETLLPSLRKYFNLPKLLHYILSGKKWPEMTKANNLDLASRIKSINIYIRMIPKEYQEITTTIFYIGVIRNYIAHYGDTISFRELAPEDCFNKIMGAFWFTWIYAEKNYLKEENY